MTSFVTFALLVTCAHYVTAEKTSGICPASKTANTSVSCTAGVCPLSKGANASSPICTTDEDCAGDKMCCSFQDSRSCADPVTPNYDATLYVIGLSEVKDENAHLKSYIEKSIGKNHTVGDVGVQRLGQCVQLHISLHTEQEAEVDAILADLQSSPVSIGHFSGGPFDVTSVKNETICKEDAVPNFQAELHVIGVPESITPEMVEDEMMRMLNGTGQGWEFYSKRVGGCLRVFVEAVLDTASEEDRAVGVLASMEEKGLTLADHQSSLKVVSNSAEADHCPTLKVNDTATAGPVPNFQARLYIIGVVGVVTFDQVKDAVIQIVEPHGSGWQVLLNTIGACMDIFVEGSVKGEKEEEQVVMALVDLEEKGLRVTSARHVFNVTSRSDETAVCKTMTLANETQIQFNMALKAPWEPRFADVSLPLMQGLVDEATPIFRKLQGFQSLKSLRAMSPHHRLDRIHVIIEATVSKNVSLTDVQQQMKSARGTKIRFNGEMREIINMSLVISDGCGTDGCGNGSCVNFTDGARCLCPEGFQGDRCHLSVPAAHHDVTCGTMDMSFFISISDLEFKPENVTLSDPRCHVHTTPSRLSGRTPLNACGTSLRLTNDSLIFSNFLILPPAAQPEGDNASVSSNLQRVIPVECHYDRVSELRLSYLPMMRQILFTETGVGQFQFHIEQFRDASFASRIADSAYPLKVTVEERVFLQLSLGESVLDEADGGKDGGPYGMEVETCVSSSSSSMMAVRNDSSQELVRDSCPANPDVRLIANSQWQNASQKSSGPHHYFRFSFKPTIDSLEDGGGKKSSSLAMGLAYIHCRVRLCAAHSCQHPVDCAPPAPSSSASGSSSGSAGRVKRAAVISELEDRERRSATGGHHLSTGPLLIMKDTDETPKSAPSPLSSPVVVALGAVAGMTTLIAVSVIVAWVLTRSRQDQYDLTTAHPCHQ